MSGFVTQVSPQDRQSMAQVDQLLLQEGIRRDANLDYTCAISDDEGRIIATGSCFSNTLRCFAVSRDHQGEGLLNQIVTHLMNVQAERGHLHLFLYTKPSAALFFSDIGFHEIARVPEKLVFMENRRDGFSGYLRGLVSFRRNGNSAAIVMNANPFTLGHQYLIEQAAAACDTLHLFLVTEDLSLFPASVRKKLVQEGVAHLPSVLLHDCGPYMISSATFPSYFLKDDVDVIEGQARLDLEIFTRIAQTMNIRSRWVGEEPASLVTGIYNRIMAEALPARGIACRIIPRKSVCGQPVSASTVRQCLKDGNWEALQALVPPSTYSWLCSEEARPVLDRIRQTDQVRHY